MLSFVFVKGADCGPPASLTNTNIQAAVNLWVSNQTSTTSGYYGPLPMWDLREVTSLASLLYVCGEDGSYGQACAAKSVFNGDVSKWDVSKVTTMYRTFSYASAFNGDVSKWDVGRVTSMSYSKSVYVYLRMT